MSEAVASPYWLVVPRLDGLRHMVANTAEVFICSTGVEQVGWRPPLPTRQVYRISELPAEWGDAIRNSQMSPEHDHLNALMD